MRNPFVAFPLAAVLLTGCAHKRPAAFEPAPAASHTGTPSAAAAAPAPPAQPPASSLIVTPAAGLTGKVAKYNDAGRFVVLEFPPGRLPSVEQRLFVYRGGLKVGELKVTGPQQDYYIVADVARGEAQPGDEVRDK
jgi:hypothetical protein